MMKSVFLSDSNVLELPDTDGDYIMVDTGALEELLEDNEDGHDDNNNDNKTSSNNDNHSFLGDEEDYDYCDDVLSEGQQSQQGRFHLSVSLTEDMILEEADQPSIRHILDEAHRSASKLGLGLSTASIGSVGEEQSMGEDDIHMHGGGRVPGRLESSASDASVLSTDGVHSDDGAETFDTTTTAANEVDNSVTVAPSEPERTEASGSKPEPPYPSVEAKASASTGRMSNKKRRKRLKQLKKAAAAAKAAAALSTDSAAKPSKVQDKKTKKTKSSTSSSAKGLRLASRHHGKKVANIAVACATESLASYKVEVGIQTPKGTAHTKAH